MKKKLLIVGIITGLMFSLTGCINMKVQDKISKNGTYTSTATEYIDRAALVEYMNGSSATENLDEFEKGLVDGGYTLQTIDGKEYYVGKPEVNTTTIQKFAKKNQQNSVKGECQLWETGMYMNFGAVKKEMDLNMTSGSLSTVYSSDLKKLYDNSFVEYTVTFDYDVVKTDSKGVIDVTDPKTVTWKMSYNDYMKSAVIEAYCNSSITVSGVKQGASYKGTKKVKFTGATSATYKGKTVKSGAKYKKHGQHTILLKADSGEQRTITFFIDKKKPVIKGIKNKKKYKKGKMFTVKDAGSGIASIKINGKKKSLISANYMLNKKGTNTIVVTDKVGNKTKVKVKIKK